MQVDHKRGEDHPLRKDAGVFAPELEVFGDISAVYACYQIKWMEDIFNRQTKKEHKHKMKMFTHHISKATQYWKYSLVSKVGGQQLF